MANGPLSCKFRTEETSHYQHVSFFLFFQNLFSRVSYVKVWPERAIKLIPPPNPSFPPYFQPSLVFLPLVK